MSWEGGGGRGESGASSSSHFRSRRMGKYCRLHSNYIIVCLLCVFALYVPLSCGCAHVVLYVGNVKILSMFRFNNTNYPSEMYFLHNLEHHIRNA